MKQKLTILLLTTLISLPAAGYAQTKIQAHEAYLPVSEMLDLQTIKPEVNVNLPKFLLKEAALGLDTANDVNLAKTLGFSFGEIVRDVQLIRVVVLEDEHTSQSQVSKGIQNLRDILTNEWMSIVSVPNDGVGIYAKTDPSGETMKGLAALISEGDGAVIINVVGQVPLAKLMQIAMAKDKLPKDFLQKIGGGFVRQSVQREEVVESEN